MKDKRSRKSSGDKDVSFLDSIIKASKIFELKDLLEDRIKREHVLNRSDNKTEPCDIKIMEIKFRPAGQTENSRKPLLTFGSEVDCGPITKDDIKMLKNSEGNPILYPKVERSRDPQLPPPPLFLQLGQSLENYLIMARAQEGSEYPYFTRSMLEVEISDDRKRLQRYWMSISNNEKRRLIKLEKESLLKRAREGSDIYTAIRDTKQ
jgi:hypothetical protein